MAQYSNYILVCGGTGCRASQSELILQNLKEAVRQNGLQDSVQVIRTGCFGFCEKGPVVKLIPDNTFYVQVTPEDADDIVNEHLIKGRKVERLLYVNPETNEQILDSKHINFYKKQLRIALRNCGFINPENIDEYIARDGYIALGKALTEMTPDDVISYTLPRNYLYVHLNTFSGVCHLLVWLWHEDSPRQFYDGRVLRIGIAPAW